MSRGSVVFVSALLLSSMVAAAQDETSLMPEPVSLFLVCAKPGSYDGKLIRVCCLVKEYGSATVAYATEEAAKYDLLEYGLALDMARCGNLEVFKAGSEPPVEGKCHELVGRLAAGAYEVREGEDSVRLPILSVDRYVAFRSQGMLPAPSWSGLGEGVSFPTAGSNLPVVSPWSLLLAPARFSRELVIAHGFVARDPEGNWMLAPSTDSPRYALPEFVYLTPDREATKAELGKGTRGADNRAVFVVGSIEDPAAGDGIRFPLAPRLRIVAARGGPVKD